MLPDGNKHVNNSGSYKGIRMENIAFSRINTTPGFASLIFFMATKVGVIVVGLLGWRAGSHVLVEKVCPSQMKVGILNYIDHVFNNILSVQYLLFIVHIYVLPISLMGRAPLMTFMKSLLQMQSSCTKKVSLPL